MSAYSKATIRRAPHGEDKYFRMRRDTAQDKNLSWEARGIISYILSQKDDWDIQVHDLMQNCQKGRVYRILDELKAAGYLEDRKKYRDDKGKWQWTSYILHERPVTNVIELPAQTPYLEKQDTDNPYPDFRDTEKRDTEKAEIKEQNTDKKKETTEKDSAPTAQGSQKPNVWYDAVKLVWKYEAGRNGNMVSFLRGTYQGKPHDKYMKYQLPQDSGLTPQKLVLWAKEYRKKELKNNPDLNMLEDLEKVQSSILAWLKIDTTPKAQLVIVSEGERGFITDSASEGVVRFERPA